jgi:hypothetical protein
MAPDRPAEASPLDHGRESEGSGSDDTTTSMGLDVTPRRTSTEYGLSRAVKTRSINRPPAELADHWSRLPITITPSNFKCFDARFTS